jgi:hypothetical protein
VQPSVSVKRSAVRVKHDRVFLRGRARDRGCHHRVAAVLVSIARKAHHRCRFVQANGRLSERRRCRNEVLLRAAGTSHWTLSLPSAHLPAGHYRVIVRAVDSSGNRALHTRNNRFTQTLR